MSHGSGKLVRAEIAPIFRGVFTVASCGRRRRTGKLPAAAVESLPSTFLAFLE